MCGQVWKRAIAEAEDNLREMNRLVSEKMSHQQRLIDKLEQYVRIHNKLAASADNSSSSNQEETSDNSEQQEQDALSAQLSSLLDSLKAMTADSVQVSITASSSSLSTDDGHVNVTVLFSETVEDISVSLTLDLHCNLQFS